MVKLTTITRIRDALPLAEGLDADKEHELYSYKSQAKVCRATFSCGDHHGDAVVCGSPLPCAPNLTYVSQLLTTALLLLLSVIHSRH